ncbi:unnamed protein product [Polarella glacialis]|uniref:Uncharacterized protein n=1 Tax=Polarella glacialis TaxID=89957 RepID=A0A813LMQ6_POLGL|nr:unnamed protein product [Polarella glacialis]
MDEPAVPAKSKTRATSPWQSRVQALLAKLEIHDVPRPSAEMPKEQESSLWEEVNHLGAQVRAGAVKPYEVRSEAAIGTLSRVDADIQSWKDALAKRMRYLEEIESILDILPSTVAHESPQKVRSGNARLKPDWQLEEELDPLSVSEFREATFSTADEMPDVQVVRAGPAKMPAMHVKEPTGGEELWQQHSDGERQFQPPPHQPWQPHQPLEPLSRQEWEEQRRWEDQRQWQDQATRQEQQQHQQQQQEHQSPSQYHQIYQSEPEQEQEQEHQSPSQYHQRNQPEPEQQEQRNNSHYLQHLEDLEQQLQQQQQLHPDQQIQEAHQQYTRPAHHAPLSLPRQPPEQWLQQQTSQQQASQHQQGHLHLQQHLPTSQHQASQHQQTQLQIQQHLLAQTQQHPRQHHSPSHDREASLNNKNNNKHNNNNNKNNNKNNNNNNNNNTGACAAAMAQVAEPLLHCACSIHTRSTEQAFKEVPPVSQEVSRSGSMPVPTYEPIAADDMRSPGGRVQLKCGPPRRNGSPDRPPRSTLREEEIKEGEVSRASAIFNRQYAQFQAEMNSGAALQPPNAEASALPQDAGTSPKSQNKTAAAQPLNAVPAAHHQAHQYQTQLQQQFQHQNQHQHQQQPTRHYVTERVQQIERGREHSPVMCRSRPQAGFGPSSRSVSPPSPKPVTHMAVRVSPARLLSEVSKASCGVTMEEYEAELRKCTPQLAPLQQESGPAAGASYGCSSSTRSVSPPRPISLPPKLTMTSVQGWAPQTYPPAPGEWLDSTYSFAAPAAAPAMFAQSQAQSQDSRFVSPLRIQQLWQNNNNNK